MMKTSTEQTFYKILDVRTDASPSEISRAYGEAVERYQDDSMAACAFFSDSERKEMLAQLEEAYLTLIHPESRSYYDISLKEMGVLEEENRYHEPSKKVMPIYDLRRKKTLYPWLSNVQVAEKARMLEVIRVSDKPSVRDILQKERLTGQDLKEIRKMLGFTLAEIYQQTRIAVGILEAIEEDRFDHLPPPVYLRSFLKLYAQCLHIDSNAVVQAYITHMKGDH